MDLRLGLRLLVTAVAITAAIAGLTAWELWQARDSRVEQAVTETHNLVGTLEQHAARTVEAVDLALDAVVDRLSHEAGGPGAAPAIHRLLANAVERLPQVTAILVFDETGRAIYDSESDPPRVLDASDRRYFTVHRERTDIGLFVDSPLLGRLTDQWVAALSRRVSKLDGSFAGVVIAPLRLSYFQQFYDRIDIGPAGAISLWHVNGALLVRTPFDARNMAPDRFEAPLFRERLIQSSAGDYRMNVVSDGGDRLVGYSRVGMQLPLIVTVGRAMRDILAPWWQRAWIDMAIAAAMIVLLLLLTLGVGFTLHRADANRRRAATAEARLRDAIESLPDGFLLWDTEDRLVMINQTVLRWEVTRGSDRIAPLVIGSTYEDIVGRRIRKGVIAVEGGDLEAYMRFRLAVHRNPTGEPIEQRFGSGDWMRVTERRTSDGGIVTITTDITAQKNFEIETRHANERLEEQAQGLAAAAQELHEANRRAQAARVNAEQANRSKSEFLTTMSHELRTPLTAVIGFSDVIINPLFGAETPEQFREYGRYIKSSGEHLLSLINDMLDLAKIESGKMELYEGDTDLAQALRAVLAMTKERAHEQAVTVVWQPPPAPIVLRADEIKLKQSLINVVSNAIKFTPAGGRITISVETTPEAIDIKVVDTGIGISGEDLGKVFEPYRQIDSSVSRRHKGTGLGMPLTLSLMQMHGGTVLLASELGVGTTVTLRLPGARLITRALERAI